MPHTNNPLFNSSAQTSSSHFIERNKTDSKKDKYSYLSLLLMLYILPVIYLKLWIYIHIRVTLEHVVNRVLGGHHTRKQPHFN